MAARQVRMVKLSMRHKTRLSSPGIGLALLALAAIGSSLLIASCIDLVEVSPSGPTATSTPEPTVTPKPDVTPTLSPETTPSPEPTASPTPTPVPESTATPEPVLESEIEPEEGVTLEKVAIALPASASLDPDAIDGGDVNKWYSHLTFDGLLEIGNDGQLLNRIVESWEANYDLTEYTLNVRPGIRFHDGSILTAEDVVYTFDRALNEDSRQSLREALRTVFSTTATDSHTVVISLVETDPFFSLNLADYRIRILPSDVPHYLIASAETRGSGAFKVMEHDAEIKTVFERFSDYWDGDKPFLDRFEIQYIPSESARVEIFRAGITDWYELDDLTMVPGFQDDPNIELKDVATSGTRQFVMDNREESPFHDKNLRKAIQSGYDRDFVRSAAFFGMSANANDHPVNPSDIYYWESQPIVERDLALASRYLAAGGYDDGVDLTLHTIDGFDLLEAALAFKETLAEANIRVEVIQSPEEGFWEDVWMSEPFVAVAWAARPIIDHLDFSLKSASIWNESHWSNPRFDELITQAATEYHFGTRAEYFREIQEILIEEVPTTYFAFAPHVVAHQSRLRGVEANPGPYRHVRDWYVED